MFKTYTPVLSSLYLTAYKPSDRRSSLHSHGGFSCGLLAKRFVNFTLLDRRLLLGVLSISVPMSSDLRMKMSIKDTFDLANRPLSLINIFKSDLKGLLLKRTNYLTV